MRNSKKAISFKASISYLTVFLLLLVGCQKDEMSSPIPASKVNKLDGLELTKINLNKNNANSRISSKLKGGSIESWLNDANNALKGSNIQIEKIEFIVAEGVGNTVFFNNRGNKQLSSDFVPNDPRNALSGTDIPYWIDGIELGTSSGMTKEETESAIISTMDTWGAVSCSEGLRLINLGKSTEYGLGDIGLVQFIVGLGGSDQVITGGIAHTGIASKDFFDAIFGPGNSVLGVTFTFIWYDDNGIPTDIDHDGKNDTAISEIYINEDYNWKDEPNDVRGNGIYDFETVVLHEVGHGLSQGHFGTAFATKNGSIHFAPYALMNAGYTIGNRRVEDTDKSGHCSIWANWPVN
ncbi:MAG: hypothetical protein KA210_09910 [Bacteroidia bacterium]|nr:hypothetical protein [Bacteroidia bacterium]